MKYIQRQPAAIYLADGTYLRGYSIGKKGTTTGEICFNTGMTGYQELFTDPSYYGQIMINTNVHIGNYGIHKAEYESNGAKIAGLIVHEFSKLYSRHDAVESLDSFLNHNNIVGISDVDTRMLVTHVRDKGVMNAVISSEEIEPEALAAILANCPPMEGLELASKVSTPLPYFYGDPNAKYKVAALDFGIKKNILRQMALRDCYIKVFPANTSFEELKTFEADGYFLANGPGDPATMQYAVDTVKKILEEDHPLFGICLGQQILAQACGVSTYKMFTGHRGSNHPVKNLLTGKCEITAQNHGFSVSEEEVEKSPLVFPTHINLNDKTIEGIRVRNKKAFSVQYHPEASPGPHDSHYLFDEFVKLMEK